MATWSGIRHKLEQEYLADSLRGHIQYYVTTYSKSPDHEGRAAIRLDGEEIIKGCYWNNWCKAHLFPQDERYARSQEPPSMPVWIVFEVMSSGTGAAIVVKW